MRVVLPLEIDGARLAIEAALVVEILGPRPWTPLPGAPARTPGVIAFRGRAVCAVDVGEVSLARPSLAPGQARRRTVIGRLGESTFALPVDAVREAYEVEAGALIEPDPEGRRFSVGEVRIAGAAMPLVDLARALAPEAPS